MEKLGKLDKNDKSINVKSVDNLLSILNDGNESEGELNTRKMVAQMNRKKKKSGGFQSMGLCHAVFKGIIRKGYKVPTPIQRKCIPVVMEGRDIVAMARTGSGKTAAFLIPLFEKLQVRSSRAGARALLLSPTRELALQTLKFIKELGKYTSLKSAVILGGENMEDQFEALHGNPDIIVATPGRLMHVLVEMDLRLTNVEYLVFDEADRLFELGFQDQLQEITSRLPQERQTLLFSATLPKQLVEFAKAGLTDPTLIRLDIDRKLSEQLKLAFLNVRTEDKPAALLHLLRNVVKPHEQTVVFTATKHHVEYLRNLLTQCGISCSYVYSSLDQTERNINIGKFRNNKTMLLIVTDVAARGLDIPMLDNAINYNFPAKSKLFVHRVGRVARAGRVGTAYSLVSSDEIAYFIDLHLFLARPINISRVEKKYQAWDTVYGRVPQTIIDDENTSLSIIMEETELISLLKVSVNAYKQYIRSRPTASPESVKRAKAMLGDTKVGIHPIYESMLDTSEELRLQVLTSMKSYKPNTTIFEIGSTAKSTGFKAMQQSRKRNEKYISKYKVKQLKLTNDRTEMENVKSENKTENTSTEEILSLLGDQSNKISTTIKRKEENHFSSGPTKRQKIEKPIRDEENYIHYKPRDHLTEKGLGMDSTKSSFEQEATGAVLDLMGDDDKMLRKQNSQRKVWDRKKKKYVQIQGSTTVKNGKIRTESGVLIKKSYQRDIYKNWKEKNKFDNQQNDNDDASSDRRGFSSRGRGRHSNKGERVKSELKKPEQILKERKLQENKMGRGRGRSSRGQGAGRGGMGRNSEHSGGFRSRGGMGRSSEHRGSSRPRGGMGRNSEHRGSSRPRRGMGRSSEHRGSSRPRGGMGRSSEHSGGFKPRGGGGARGFGKKRGASSGRGRSAKRRR